MCASRGADMTDWFLFCSQLPWGPVAGLNHPQGITETDWVVYFHILTPGINVSIALILEVLS